MDDPLVIAGKEFRSRLMVGTGRHRTMDEMVESVEASGAEIITVAIRRLDLDNPNEKSILDYFDWNKYTILPNTAACRTADEAVFIARLARELTGSNWVKLEVQPDPKSLLPDPIGTFEAAKILVDDGFVVLPYIHADPVLAARLEEVGCATVMPLGSPIGSGQGILTLEEVKIIVEQASVPVVVDAGPVGSVSGSRNRRGSSSRQYGHRPGKRPGRHGRGLQAWSRGRTHGLSGRTHRPQG